MGLQDRSYRPIEIEDLQRLGELARVDREEFFDRNPRYAPLRQNVIAVALCQGAALHFIDGRTGVKDFDVWTFYSVHASLRFPPRRMTHRDYGIGVFGRSIDRPDFVGRRVDLLGRSLGAAPDTDPVQAIREYLGGRATPSAMLLAKKAVVLIEPDQRTGEVVWPVASAEDVEGP